MESSVVTGGGTKAKDPEGLSGMVRMGAKGPEGRRRGRQRWGSPTCILVLDLPQVSELRSGNINKGHGEEIPEGAAVNPPSSPANTRQKPLANTRQKPLAVCAHCWGMGLKPFHSLSTVTILQMGILAFLLGSPGMLKTRPSFWIRQQPCASLEHELNLACHKFLSMQRPEAPSAPLTDTAKVLFWSVHHPTSCTLGEASAAHQEGWTKSVYPGTWQEMWVK